MLAASFLVASSSVTADLDVRWAAYKERFAKSYADDAKAFAAFAANDDFIQEQNKRGLSFTLAHNPFSDLTWVDFKAIHLGGYDLLSSARTKNYAPEGINHGAFADSIDWVAKGAVTEVKNQERCGSCWAFSTTGAIEGAYQIAGNPLTEFSEQELVACDNNSSGHGGMDNGCKGGLMDNAFTWIKSNGLCTEDAYPYTAGNGTSPACAMSSCPPAVSVTGFVDVKNESGMIPAISLGPVSVAIEADRSFQFYHGGVLDNTGCGNKLDHGVLVVGYGSDANHTQYYKVSRIAFWTSIRAQQSDTISRKFLQGEELVG